MDDAAHRALILPLLNEIGAINKRYGFRARDSRSPEDNARFDDLWAQIRAVDDRYDAANPIAPCPSCGKPRRASRLGIHTTYGCDEAILGG